MSKREFQPWRDEFRDYLLIVVLLVALANLVQNLIGG